MRILFSILRYCHKLHFYFQIVRILLNPNFLGLTFHARLMEKRNITINAIID